MKAPITCLICLLLGTSLNAAPKFFPYCVSLPPAELKALGYDGCEVPFVTGEEIAKRLKAADDTQMVVGKVYIQYNLRNPIPKEQFEKLVEALKGRDTIIEVMLMGIKPNAEEGIAPAVAVLREWGEIAAKNGIRIALYNHAEQFSESVAFNIGIVDKVNLPNVGFCFIVCHWVRTEGANDYRPLLGANAKKLFIVGINGAIVGKTSWKDLIRPLDEGDFDNAKLLRFLNDIGYKGMVELQCYGIASPEREHLIRSMNAWKKLTSVP